MQLHNWGEDSFIDYLKGRFAARGAVGIGDDCAVIPGKESALLITTDALVENIHFIKEQIDPKDLGYKTVAVNVSDIAAMGGKPEYAFLTIALPATLSSEWLKAFVEGLEEACTKWNLELLGGDTVGSKREIFLNLTLMGSAQEEQVKYRKGAEPGDLIFVTGYLGDSGAGLKALQEGVTRSEEIAHLIDRHFRPEPSPEEGQWLSRQSGVHAMMDLSDGLDTDLKRLIKASRCGAAIETTELPLSSALIHASEKYGWNPIDLALGGGEDYVLLVTASSEESEAIRASFQARFGHPLYKVGAVTRERGVLRYQKKGENFCIKPEGFDHFK